MAKSVTPPPKTVPSKSDTYAGILRYKMKTGETAEFLKSGRDEDRRPMTIKGVADAVGYCYEHIRKVLHGEPVVSRELNGLLCQLFGLDEEAMWVLAAREKMDRFARSKGVPTAAELPRDTRLREAWAMLTTEQKNRLVKIAEGMAEENRLLLPKSKTA